MNTSPFKQAVNIFRIAVNIIWGGVYKMIVTVMDIGCIVAIIVSSMVVHLLGKLGIKTVYRQARNIFKDSAKVMEEGLWHLWKP